MNDNPFEPTIIYSGILLSFMGLQFQENTTVFKIALDCTSFLSGDARSFTLSSSSIHPKQQQKTQNKTKTQTKTKQQTDKQTDKKTNKQQQQQKPGKQRYVHVFCLEWIFMPHVTNT